jgi:hypothetical protein
VESGSVAKFWSPPLATSPRGSCSLAAALGAGDALDPVVDTFIPPSVKLIR